jgi:para-aminobenzoate synthetase component 1
MPAEEGMLQILDAICDYTHLTNTTDETRITWIGHIGYDIAQLTERLPKRAPDDYHAPLLRWSLYDFYFRRRTDGNWSVYTWNWKNESSEAIKEREATARRLLAKGAIFRRPAGDSPPVLIASTPREDFLAKIARAKEYIDAGDIYQVNLAQRWSIKTSDSAETIYRRLCHESPASYSALLKFGGKAIISASPELLLQRDGPWLRSRPIKGTRPRMENATQDQAMAEELLASEKDKAELAMIVDLVRNDLGRVSEFGSVKVTKPRELEQLPTVWHTVAQIESRFDSVHRFHEIIAALCPGGSVTGAPKIRAMEIIDELESHRRGVYCGNIGYIAPTHATLNIAIRTIQMSGNIAHVWAGGGIVADSVPQLEYEETLHKAAAMFRALNLVI